MWGLSLPWHKVLNAVVAELSIYKWKNQRIKEDVSILCYSEVCAYALIRRKQKVLSDECLGVKLRVIENWCVLYDSLTYMFIYKLNYTLDLLLFFSLTFLYFGIKYFLTRWQQPLWIFSVRVLEWFQLQNEICSIPVTSLL